MAPICVFFLNDLIKFDFNKVIFRASKYRSRSLNAFYEIDYGNKGMHLMVVNVPNKDTYGKSSCLPNKPENGNARIVLHTEYENTVLDEWFHILAQKFAEFIGTKDLPIFNVNDMKINSARRYLGTKHEKFITKVSFSIEGSKARESLGITDPDVRTSSGDNNTHYGALDSINFLNRENINNDLDKCQLAFSMSIEVKINKGKIVSCRANFDINHIKIKRDINVVLPLDKNILWKDII